MNRSQHPTWYRVVAGLTSVAVFLSTSDAYALISASSDQLRPELSHRLLQRTASGGVSALELDVVAQATGLPVATLEQALREVQGTAATALLPIGVDRGLVLAGLAAWMVAPEEGTAYLQRQGLAPETLSVLTGALRTPGRPAPGATGPSLPVIGGAAPLTEDGTAATARVQSAEEAVRALQADETVDRLVALDWLERVVWPTDSETRDDVFAHADDLVLGLVANRDHVHHEVRRMAQTLLARLERAAMAGFPEIRAALDRHAKDPGTGIGTVATAALPPSGEVQRALRTAAQHVGTVEGHMQRLSGLKLSGRLRSTDFIRPLRAVRGGGRWLRGLVAGLRSEAPTARAEAIRLARRYGLAIGIIGGLASSPVGLAESASPDAQEAFVVASVLGAEALAEEPAPNDDVRRRASENGRRGLLAGLRTMLGPVSRQGGVSGDPVLSVLRELIAFEDDWRVRFAAARAVTVIGGAAWALRPDLARAVELEEVRRVRVALHDALATLGGGFPGPADFEQVEGTAATARAPLDPVAFAGAVGDRIARLQASSAEQRLHALRWLGVAALPHYQDGTEDLDASLRELDRQALTLFRGLVPNLTHDDGRVRAEAWILGVRLMEASERGRVEGLRAAIREEAGALRAAFAAVGVERAEVKLSQALLARAEAPRAPAVGDRPAEGTVATAAMVDEVRREFQLRRQELLEGRSAAIVGKIGGTSGDFQEANSLVGLVGARQEFPTNTTSDGKTIRSADRWVRHAVDAISEVIAGRPGHLDGIEYVYFSAPGFFGPDGTLIDDNANIPALKKGFWFEREFERELFRRFGRHVPVIVVHDATAAAIAEMRAYALPGFPRGTAADVRNFAYIIAGTGIGTRFIVNGRPFLGDERVNWVINEGPHHELFSGDPQHPAYTYTALETKGLHRDTKHRTVGGKKNRKKNPFYKTEDLEDRTAGPALERYGRELVQQALLAEGTDEVTQARRRVASELLEVVDHDVDRVDGRLLGRMARAGNVIARQVYEERGRELGIGFADFMIQSERIFGEQGYVRPELVVIGSGVAKTGDVFLNAVRRGVAERFENEPMAFDVNNVVISNMVEVDDTAREMLGGLPTEAFLDNYVARPLAGALLAEHRLGTPEEQQELVARVVEGTVATAANGINGQADPEALVRQLDSRMEVGRWQAVRGLLEHGDPMALPALLHHVDRPFEDHLLIRSAAGRHAGGIAAALPEDDPRRLIVAWALVHAIEEAQRSDDPPWLRQAFLDAGRAVLGMPELAEAQDVVQALSALVGEVSQTVKQALGVLETGTAEMRVGAVATLQQSEHPAVLGALTFHLDPTREPSATVRGAAAQALKELAAPWAPGDPRRDFMARALDRAAFLEQDEAVKAGALAARDAVAGRETAAAFARREAPPGTVATARAQAASVDRTERGMLALWDRAERLYEEMKLSEAYAAYHRGLRMYEQAMADVARRQPRETWEATLDRIRAADVRLDAVHRRFRSRIGWLQRMGHDQHNVYVRPVRNDGTIKGKPVHWVTAHREGIQHATAEVLLVTQDGHLVVQQRPDRKIDVSAAGHIRAGETEYRTAALRLITSETGLLHPRPEALKELTGVVGERKIGSNTFQGLPHYDQRGAFHSKSGEPDNRELSKFFLYVLSPEEAKQVQSAVQAAGRVHRVGLEPLHTIERAGVETTGLIERIQPEGLDDRALEQRLDPYASTILQFFRHPTNVQLLEREVMADLLKFLKGTDALDAVQASAQGVGMLGVAAVPKASPARRPLHADMPGVLVFDIDRTLADRDARLPSETRSLLRSLRRAGYGIAFITGQPINVQYPRIVADVVMREGEGASQIGGVKRFEAAELDGLVIYANDGAQKYVFEAGELREVEAYRKGALADRATQQQVRTTVRGVLDDLRADPQRLTPEEQALVSGVTGFDAAKLAGLADLVRTHEPRWFDRDTQLAFKFKAFEKDPDSKPMREFLKAVVLRRLAARGITGLNVSTSGGSTVGIIPQGVDKATALADVLQEVPASKVVYFGDEFEEGGNDAIVATYAEQRAPGLRVVSVGIDQKTQRPLAPRGTVWIGNGPAATQAALGRLVASLSTVATAQRDVKGAGEAFQTWRAELEPGSEWRRPARRNPEAFLLAGGTSGNFFTGVIPELVEIAPPSREIHLNTIVSLSPFDDGGASRALMDMFRPYLGDFPPPGDEVNVMAGLTSGRKAYVVRHRPKDAEGGLTPVMKRALEEAELGQQSNGDPIVDRSGQPVAQQPLDANWEEFKQEMLALAVLLDERYFTSRKRGPDGRPRRRTLGIAGNSLGNFFNLAMKLKAGAYREDTKQIDEARYADAIEQMVTLLGIQGLHIVPSSFQKGTLYVVLRDFVILFGGRQYPLTPEVLARGELQLPGGVTLKVGRRADGAVTLSNEDRTITATVTEHHFDTIRRGDPNQPDQDSRTLVTVRGGAQPQAPVTLGTSGQGEVVTLGAVEFKLKGRLVIEQTHITDSLHASPMEKLGLINGVVPRASRESVKLLEETQDIIVMGPGSFPTSLVAEFLSPEIVAALIKRRQEGLPVVFVVNPVRDNETVDYSYPDLIRVIEAVTGHPFEALFSHIVVNDLVGSARQALQVGTGQATRDLLRLIVLLDTLKEKREKEGIVEDKARDPKAFSTLAKLSRGAFGAHEDEIARLVRMIKRGKVEPDFQFEQTTALQQEMAGRGVEMILAPLAGRVLREKRVAGKQEYEEGVGYNRAVLASVLDGILKTQQRGLPAYQALLRLFDGHASALDREITRFMSPGLYPEMPRRAMIQQLYRWWVEGAWPQGTPLISAGEAGALPFPAVLVANGAYNLVWMDDANHPIAPPERLIAALNGYLRAGGILVLLSGWPREVLEGLVITRLDPGVRQRVIVAAESGARAWSYTREGDLRSLGLEPLAVTAEQREDWARIMREVFEDEAFGLKQQLRGPLGQVIAEPARLEQRGDVITIEMPGRTNVQSEVARGLRWMRRGDQGVHFDMREPVIADLRARLERVGLGQTVQIVPPTPGGGSINTFLLSMEDAMRRLLKPNGPIQLVAEREVGVRELLFMMAGRRAGPLAEVPEFQEAQFVQVNLAGRPDQLPDRMKVFQGPPGPLGVARVLEELVTARAAGDAGTVATALREGSPEGIEPASAARPETGTVATAGQTAGEYRRMAHETRRKLQAGRFGTVLVGSNIKEFVPDQRKLYGRSDQLFARTYRDHVQIVRNYEQPTERRHDLPGILGIIELMLRDHAAAWQEGPVVVVPDGGAKTRFNKKSFEGQTGLGTVPGRRYQNLREMSFNGALAVLALLPDGVRRFVAVSGSDNAVVLGAAALAGVPLADATVIAPMIRDASVIKGGVRVPLLSKDKGDLARLKGIEDDPNWTPEKLRRALTPERWHQIERDIDREKLTQLGAVATDDQGRMIAFLEKEEDLGKLVRLFYQYGGALFKNPFFDFLGKDFAGALLTELQKERSTTDPTLTLDRVPASFMQTLYQAHMMNAQPWEELGDQLRREKKTKLSSEDWRNLKVVVDRVFEQEARAGRGQVYVFDFGEGYYWADVADLREWFAFLGEAVSKPSVREVLGMPRDTKVDHATVRIAPTVTADISPSAYVEWTVVTGEGELVVEDGALLSGVLLDIPRGERVIVRKGAKVRESDLRGMQLEIHEHALVERVFPIAGPKLIARDDERVSVLKMVAEDARQVRSLRSVPFKGKTVEEFAGNQQAWNEEVAKHEDYLGQWIYEDVRKKDFIELPDEELGGRTFDQAQRAVDYLAMDQRVAALEQEIEAAIVQGLAEFLEGELQQGAAQLATEVASRGPLATRLGVPKLAAKGQREVERAIERFAAARAGDELDVHQMIRARRALDWGILIWRALGVRPQGPMFEQIVRARDTLTVLLREEAAEEGTVATAARSEDPLEGMLPGEQREDFIEEPQEWVLGKADGYIQADPDVEVVARLPDGSERRIPASVQGTQPRRELLDELAARYDLGKVLRHGDELELIFVEREVPGEEATVATARRGRSGASRDKAREVSEHVDGLATGMKRVLSGWKQEEEDHPIMRLFRSPPSVREEGRDAIQRAANALEAASGELQKAVKQGRGEGVDRASVLRAKAEVLEAKEHLAAAGGEGIAQDFDGELRAVEREFDELETGTVATAGARGEEPAWDQPLMAGAEAWVRDSQNLGKRLSVEYPATDTPLAVDNVNTTLLGESETEWQGRTIRNLEVLGERFKLTAMIETEQGLNLFFQERPATGKPPRWLVNTMEDWIAARPGGRIVVQYRERRDQPIETVELQGDVAQRLRDFQAWREKDVRLVSVHQSDLSNELRIEFEAQGLASGTVATASREEVVAQVGVTVHRLQVAVDDALHGAGVGGWVLDPIREARQALMAAAVDPLEMSQGLRRLVVRRAGELALAVGAFDPWLATSRDLQVSGIPWVKGLEALRAEVTGAQEDAVFVLGQALQLDDTMGGSHEGLRQVAADAEFQVTLITAPRARAIAQRLQQQGDVRFGAAQAVLARLGAEGTVATAARTPADLLEALYTELRAVPEAPIETLVARRRAILGAALGRLAEAVNGRAVALDPSARAQGERELETFVLHATNLAEVGGRGETPSAREPLVREFADRLAQVVTVAPSTPAELALTDDEDVTWLELGPSSVEGGAGDFEDDSVATAARSEDPLERADALRVELITALRANPSFLVEVTHRTEQGDETETVQTWSTGSGEPLPLGVRLAAVEQAVARGEGLLQAVAVSPSGQTIRIYVGRAEGTVATATLRGEGVAWEQPLTAPVEAWIRNAAHAEDALHASYPNEEGGGVTTPEVLSGDVATRVQRLHSLAESYWLGAMIEQEGRLDLVFWQRQRQPEIPESFITALQEWVGTHADAVISATLPDGRQEVLGGDVVKRVATLQAWMRVYQLDTVVQHRGLGTLAVTFATTAPGEGTVATADMTLEERSRELAQRAAREAMKRPALELVLRAAPWTDAADQAAWSRFVRPPVGAGGGPATASEIQTALETALGTRGLIVAITHAANRVALEIHVAGHEDPAAVAESWLAQLRAADLNERLTGASRLEASGAVWLPVLMAARPSLLAELGEARRDEDDLEVSSSLGEAIADASAATWDLQQQAEAWLQDSPGALAAVVPGSGGEGPGVQVIDELVERFGDEERRSTHRRVTALGSLARAYHLVAVREQGETGSPDARLVLTFGRRERPARPELDGTVATASAHGIRQWATTLAIEIEGFRRTREYLLLFRDRLAPLAVEVGAAPRVSRGIKNILHMETRLKEAVAALQKAVSTDSQSDLLEEVRAAQRHVQEARSYRRSSRLLSLIQERLSALLTPGTQAGALQGEVRFIAGLLDDFHDGFDYTTLFRGLVAPEVADFAGAILPREVSHALSADWNLLNAAEALLAGRRAGYRLRPRQVAAAQSHLADAQRDLEYAGLVSGSDLLRRLANVQQGLEGVARALAQERPLAAGPEGTVATAWQPSPEATSQLLTVRARRWLREYPQAVLQVSAPAPEGREDVRLVRDQKERELRRLTREYWVTGAEHTRGPVSHDVIVSVQLAPRPALGEPERAIQELAGALENLDEREVHLLLENLQMREYNALLRQLARVMAQVVIGGVPVSAGVRRKLDDAIQRAQRTLVGRLGPGRGEHAILMARMSRLFARVVAAPEPGVGEATAATAWRGGEVFASLDEGLAGAGRPGVVAVVQEATAGHEPAVVMVYGPSLMENGPGALEAMRDLAASRAQGDAGLGAVQFAVHHPGAASPQEAEELVAEVIADHTTIIPGADLGAEVFSAFLYGDDLQALETQVEELEADVGPVAVLVGPADWIDQMTAPGLNLQEVIGIALELPSDDNRLYSGRAAIELSLEAVERLAADGELGSAFVEQFQGLVVQDPADLQRYIIQPQVIDEQQDLWKLYDDFAGGA